MSANEWKAIGIFGLIVFGLSFVSMNAALFLLITVGVAAFVTRLNKTTVANVPTGSAKGVS